MRQTEALASVIVFVFSVIFFFVQHPKHLGRKFNHGHCLSHNFNHGHCLSHIFFWLRPWGFSFRALLLCVVKKPKGDNVIGCSVFMFSKYCPGNWGILEFFSRFHPCSCQESCSEQPAGNRSQLVRPFISKTLLNYTLVLFMKENNSLE